MNPADRLIHFIETVLANPTKPNTSVSRNYRLALFADDESTTERDLVKRLEAITTQAEAVQQLLQEDEIPEHLYKPQTDHFISAISASRFNDDAASVRSVFDKELLLALRWASWKIGELEIEADEHALADLKMQLSELTEMLNNGELPRSLRVMVRNQVRNIENAIAGYVVTGIEPVKEALNKCVGEFTISQALVREELGKATEKEKEGLRKFASVCKNVAKFVQSTSTTLKAGTHLYLQGETLVKALLPDS